MDIVEELYKKYPFAFEYRASQLTDSNEETILSLKHIEIIKNEFEFVLLSAEDKCDFIADICTNINFIFDYDNEKKIMFTDYDYAEMRQSLINSWNNLHDYYYSEFTYNNNKKEIETALNNLQTKSQKINYLNRYITDYKIKSNYTELTSYWDDTDETLNFLNSELKFWENYIEEPEEQNKTLFKNIKWNKDIIDLSELIFVLQKSESIYKNGKNITQKDLTELFNIIFNTDITNVSDNLNKGFGAYKRKEDNKTYIKSLYDIIEQRIKEKKNKN